MYIYRLIVFGFLFSTSVLYGQKNLYFYENKVKEISELTDEHEKRFQLAEFSKKFQSFLTHYNKDVIPTDTAHIQYTKSSDSKYQVYYYNSYKDGIVFRLDWYIVSGVINERKVMHFYDESFSHKDKKGIGTFQLHLSRKTVGDIDFYPLTFSFKADMKIYRQYHDVAITFMFEQLLLRDTKKERLALNDSIYKRMEVLWADKELFDDPLSGMKRISTLISEDKKVKVSTWNVELPNSENHFFGAVVIKDDDGNINVHNLEDDTKKMRSPEKAVLSPRKWYGAVYYDMIPVKDKTYGTYYMLLGYKPNNEMTKIKVVDPLYIINKVYPKFGHSIFQTDRTIDKRLVFEYAASTNMMLQYDKENKRIVLDHLAPSNNLYKGNFRFYGPDFSYDSYVLEKGKWVLYEDVDLRNPAIQH